MLGHLKCLIGRHEPDGGTNHFDLPFNVWAIPDEYLNDAGFLATHITRCERCGIKLDTKYGHDPEQPVRYPLLPNHTKDPLDAELVESFQ